MYAKLINSSQIEFAPKILFYNDTQIINPTHSNYIEAGYKIFLCNKPNNNVEEFSIFDYIISYKETEFEIIQVWTKIGKDT